MANDSTPPGLSDERAEEGGDGENELATSTDVRTGYISGLTFTNQPVEYAVVDENAIFEGDICLGPVDEVEAATHAVEEPERFRDDRILHGVFISNSRSRWPDGVVPYVVDADLPNQRRVSDAIEHWEEQTNLRFRERANEPDYVRFVPANGCWSHVGMMGGEQRIGLGSGCSTGSAIHEIGHCIGLFHEQSREDRDEYIEVVLENVDERYQHNFTQHISDGDDVGPYDYGSIMHYPDRAFARDRSTPTILSPQPIGQRTRLSDLDVRTANTIYPRTTTLSETSTNGPVVTSRSSQLLVCWTGAGNDRLNFVRSSDGATFTGKTTLDERSPETPDLTVHDGQYVVAWTGIDGGRLTVASSDDGERWSEPVTLDGTSVSPPALASFGPYLYLAWRDSDDRIAVLRSTDGRQWRTKRYVGTETTNSGPSVVQQGDHLLLAWRGLGDDRLTVMRSYNGTSFHGKVTLDETTRSKPNLHVHGGRAYLSWQGVGNRYLNVIPSRSGVDWHGKITSGETCVGGPVLGSLDPSGEEERLLWCWTGTDDRHRLNIGLI